MRREPLPFLFGREVRALHAVGVGGMGVGPLAIYLADRGFRVTGEDDAMPKAMRAELERAGVTITASGGVPEAAQLLMISSAIKPGHHALLAAQSRGLPVVRRGEMLAEVTRERKVVAICGSHGKTTTTAMLIAALRAARIPAGYVLGGLWADDGWAPARAGTGDWVVAEIDESDGTIDRFNPALTVVVNLDWDHPDRYRRPEELEQTFQALMRRTTETVLINDTCGLSARLAVGDETAPMPQVLTFGRSGDYSAVPTSAEQIDPAFKGLQLSLGGRFTGGRALVRARGAFNQANATAALAAAAILGAQLGADTLAMLPGVRRRQAILHSSAALTVIEDYAHHPAEVRALLGSLRADRSAAERLVAVFQPHRYSRTAQFKSEFAAALAAADAVYLIDVYPAGEAPVNGGTTADLYAELKRQSPTLPVTYIPGNTAAVLSALHRGGARGDLVAFVGAGDIEYHARHWLADLEEANMDTKAWDDLAQELTGRLGDASRVRRDELLATKTTLRVGGPARIYAEPASVEDLHATLNWARERRVAVHVLGRGSNLLVPDSGVAGLVVSLRHASWETFAALPDGRVCVGAGLRLKNLCGLATKAGLSGFEFLEGIPGNVGGALRMNAGAMGGWVFDVVDEVDIMSLDGEITTLRREEMHVDYRHCAELQTAIALGAILRPAAASEAASIGRQIDVYREKRQKSQPREPSAGCIFKNPANDSAGRLIEACGLKGRRVGDAEVSAVHGNFIINRGKASGDDVIELVRQVRAQVQDKTGIQLEPEVLLYGQNWEDVL